MISAQFQTVGRDLFTRGLVSSNSGNLSMRLGDQVIITRRGAMLKHKNFAGMARLPSLEVLDRIQFRAMLFGFVFLTLGIGAGGAWAVASRRFGLGSSAARSKATGCS